MKASDIVIGLLIFSAVIIAGATFAGDLADKYDVEIDETFESTYSHVDNLTEMSQDMYDSTTGAKLGVLDYTVVPIWGALKMIGESVSVVSALTTEFADELNLPSWIPGLVLALFTTILAFILISAIMKHRL